MKNKDKAWDGGEADEKAFEVAFKCYNCNKEWEEGFCKGDYVTGNLITGVWLQDRRCTGRMSCNYCKKIKCPVCGAEDIEIISRRPLW